jgi:hypothetical protein
MTASKTFIFLASAALAMLAGSALDAHAQANPADLPADVTAFVSRRSGCMECSQKAFGPEGKTQIDNIMRTMESLKCGEIAIDEKELRQKFAGNPAILQALDTNWVRVVKRLPVRVPVPPDSDQPR